MYVCACVSVYTGPHTHTHTQPHVCVCVCYVCMCLYVYVYTGPFVLRHMFVCPCDPLETKFTPSYHFLTRTAHTVPEKEERFDRGRAGVDPTHGWRITEPRNRAVPFHRGGGIHHDQCILGRMHAEEPQTQDRDGRMSRSTGGGNIHRYACVIVYKLNHGGRRGRGGGPAGAQPYINLESYLEVRGWLQVGL